MLQKLLVEVILQKELLGFLSYGHLRLQIASVYKLNKNT